jgi:hypothetical protein
VRTRTDYDTQVRRRRLAELRNRAAELERRLSDARTSLQRELTGFGGAGEPREAIPSFSPADDTAACGAGATPAVYLDPDQAFGHEFAYHGYSSPGYGGSAFADPDYENPGYEAVGYGDGPGDDPGDGSTHRYDRETPDEPSARGGAEAAGEDASQAAEADGIPLPGDRTEVLVSHGRSTANHRRLSRRQLVVAGVTAAVLLLTLLVIVLTSGGAAWPASVATVQREVTQACQNPNVKSEPGQVNFACAKDTRQVLWVFSLLASANNPNFADSKTGRQGLEPISPAQGGEVAWSLNLHHPYDPANPVDSIEVAARAVNNIVGGATVTGSDGSPVVQPGLESDSANCARYTGSPALTTVRGFPSRCARPVSSPQGQAALVADVYQRWMTGATPQAAHDAAVLFRNADNPGDPQVQQILRHLLDQGFTG